MSKELTSILKDSFLKELISKGVSIFDYQNNTLYYETENNKMKADILVTDEEVISLVNKISLLHGKEFNNSNPNISISNSEVKLSATKKPFTENVSFYLDIGNGME